MKGLLRNSVGLVVVLVLGFYSEVIVSFYKSVLFDRYTSLLLVVLLAVVFGFMMVIILFAMRFLSGYETRENSFLNKLMEDEKFDFYTKPMFRRFIRCLYVILVALVYFLCLSVLQNIAFEEIFSSAGVVAVVSVFFYVYLVLTIRFFLVVKNIIRDLDSLTFIFMRKDKNE